MIKTKYKLSAPLKHTCKIALVSDIHEFPGDTVIKMLREECPDVICIPGDTFERHGYGENLDKCDTSLASRIVCSLIHKADRLIGDRSNKDTSPEYAYSFLLKASEIAPIVMSLGNHELYLTEEDLSVLNKAGVYLLEDSMVEVKGILFGGLSSKQKTGKIDTDFLSSFSSRPQYKILLCHHPEYFPEIKPYEIPLILSGHCHGGQIRLFGRGVFGPGQGLFPRYHHGMYEKRLVVSSGCSNTAAIPRFGNPAEVVFLQLGKYESYKTIEESKKDRPKIEQ